MQTHCAEDIVQCHVRKFGNWCNTEVSRSIVRDLNKCLIGAESSANLCKVRRIEVATTLQLVLDGYLSLRGEASKHFMIVLALLERVEPNEGSNDDDEYAVGNEHPVQQNQTTNGMVGLDDGADGNHPCNKKGHTQDKSR